MKKTESIRAISSALLALASSVLTDLIYGELSNVSYEVRFIDGITLVEQTNELSFGIRLLAIGAVFFTIWTFLFIVRWCFPQLIKRMTYRNKQNYTKRDVYLNYVSAKSILAETMRNTQTESLTAIFYSKEIESAVTLLYNTFCPSKKRLCRVVKATFRTGTVGDFEQRISPYEYLAVINVAENLLMTLKCANKDSMLQEDCKMLYRQLEQLKKVGE